MNDYKDGCTKQYTIKLLRKYELSKINCHKLRISDLIQHGRDRKRAGTLPATVSYDISHQAVMKKSPTCFFNVNANTALFDIS